MLCSAHACCSPLLPPVCLQAAGVAG
jgi:hypothetical protein